MPSNAPSATTLGGESGGGDRSPRMIRMKYSLGLDTPPGKYPSDSEESPSGAVDADHAARGRSGRADAPPVQERVGSRLIEGDLGISGERRVGRQHPVPEPRR